MMSALSAAPPRRRPALSVALAAIGLVLAADPVPAQEISEDMEITPAMRRAYFAVAPFCAEDANRLCSDIVPGNGRVTRCVLEHVDELTSPCKEKVEEKIDELLPE